MLANRTEAIQVGTDRAGSPRRSVASLVLGGAPATGSDARSGEELAARIARLATMATAIHVANATAMRCAQAGAGAGACADLGADLAADCLEVTS